ncbi:MAG: hypothetical protein QOG93_844 [Gaiellaceae bacterium]|nr:hypothetical protein [Gaiellaceae bacterium]
MGVDVGEDLYPRTKRSRAVRLSRAKPRPATLHPFARDPARAEHLDLHHRGHRRLRLPARHLRRNAPAEEHERDNRPPRDPEARCSDFGNARNTTAPLATALPTRRWLHPPLDCCRQPPAGAEVRPCWRSAALSRSLFPRIAANHSEDRAPLRLRRSVRSMLRARRTLEPSRRDHRVRLTRLDELRPLRDRPAFVSLRQRLATTASQGHLAESRGTFMNTGAGKCFPSTAPVCHPLDRRWQADAVLRKSATKSRSAGLRTDRSCCGRRC